MNSPVDHETSNHPLLPFKQPDLEINVVKYQVKKKKKSKKRATHDWTLEREMIIQQRMRID